jgi:Ser-tRNA(Ala) deacylase AlaX
MNMRVAKVFWDDPYLTELTAKVTSIDKERITVDRTIAYAFSGGQESDYGTIDKYPILAAATAERQIVYSLDKGHDLHVNDAVLIKIDWDRRYKLMRLHFAAEIVLELLYQNYNRPQKIGAHISADKARLDFVWPGNISLIFDFLEQATQQMVDNDVLIQSEFSDQENEIRYWQIENFSKVHCGGTHIKKTGEIGKVSLKRNNIGKGKERIEITLG